MGRSGFLSVFEEVIAIRAGGPEVAAQLKRHPEYQKANRVLLAAVNEEHLSTVEAVIAETAYKVGFADGLALVYKGLQ